MSWDHDTLACNDLLTRMLITFNKHNATEEQIYYSVHGDEWSPTPSCYVEQLQYAARDCVVMTVQIALGVYAEVISDSCLT